jgi:hypothetical protein
MSTAQQKQSDGSPSPSRGGWNGDALGGKQNRQSSTASSSAALQNDMFHSREGMLRYIKSTLQPLYNEKMLTRDQFAQVSKVTLLYGMQQPYGSYGWSQQGVKDRLIAELEAVGVPWPYRPVAASTEVQEQRGRNGERRATADPPIVAEARAPTPRARHTDPAPTPATNALLPSSSGDATLAAQRTPATTAAATSSTSAITPTLKAHREAIQSLKAKLAPHIAGLDGGLGFGAASRPAPGYSQMLHPQPLDPVQSKAAMDSFYRSNSRGGRGTATRKASPGSGHYMTHSPTPRNPGRSPSGPIVGADVGTPIAASAVIPILLEVSSSSNRASMVAGGTHANHTQLNGGAGSSPGRGGGAGVPSPASVVHSSPFELFQVVHQFEQRHSLVTEESVLRQQLIGEEVQERVELSTHPSWLEIKGFLTRLQRYAEVSGVGIGSNGTPVKRAAGVPDVRSHHEEGNGYAKGHVDSPSTGRGKSSTATASAIVPNGNAAAYTTSASALQYLEKKAEVYRQRIGDAVRKQAGATGVRTSPKGDRERRTGTPPNRQAPFIQSFEQPGFHPVQDQRTPRGEAVTVIQASPEDRRGETPKKYGTMSLPPQDAGYIHTRNPYPAPPAVQSAMQKGAGKAGQPRGLSPRSPAAARNGHRSPAPNTHHQGAKPKIGATLSGAPTRLDVVEYLRSLLQPAYNQGRLPQTTFTDIVRTVSAEFFTQQWRTGTPEDDEEWQAFILDRVAKRIEL